MVVVQIACGLAAVILFLYYYSTWTYNYWKKRNIPGPKPVPFFGNVLNVGLRNISIGRFLHEICCQYKDAPVIGIYSMRNPVLIVNDPALVKTVLIKDFSTFGSRGLPLNEKLNPLEAHLFFLELDRWKPLRAKFSPVFTTGKLKDMFSMIANSSEGLIDYLNKISKENQILEIYDVAARFTTDVIGNCAFGVDAKALTDSESDFRRMGRRAFAPNGVQVIRFRLQQFAPFFADLFAYFLRDNVLVQFFTDLIMENIRYRKENNIVRNDFVHTLMELHSHPEKLNIELTETLLTAQAFLFFTAGFETSATTITNALYELALNPDIQSRLRAELDEAFEQNGNDMEYDSIKKLKYLEAVFQETLRKHPPVPVLTRETLEDYTLEDLNLFIPKGQKVWIPLFSIHRNPEYYPKPAVFDPERFLDEGVKSARHPLTYLPFGDGPRNCIGARFAIYQTKVGLTQIIRNFKLDVCDKTTIPYVEDPKAFLITPKDGMYLKVTPLKSE